MPSKRRLLFLSPGPQPPDADATKNALYHLSRHFEGDLLSVWWEKDPEQGMARVPEIERTLGSFRYHPTFSFRKRPAAKVASDFRFYVRQGRALARAHGGYDAIVSYGVFNTAAAGWVLSRLTGAPLILDIPGNPFRGHAFDQRALASARRQASRALVPFLVRHAAAIKLLYPSQVDGLQVRPGAPVRVFHDFVPLSRIAGRAADSPPYVLFVGYPWKLKGVDVLIEAFKRVSDRHPAYTLKILGHCPDRAPWEALRAGHPRIEFLKALPHAQAMELMAGCSAFVLPSRTEAMGRVILEAMAAGKPVIASAVDGIPHYVHDGETGLLFPPEDVGALAERLDRVLGSPALAARLAQQGHRYVRSELSEERYVEGFVELVDATIAAWRGGGAESRVAAPALRATA